MVRIVRGVKGSVVFLVVLVEGVMETARTASATASSGAEGSKRMVWPTLMTRRVIGGCSCCVCFVRSEGDGRG